MKKRTEFEWMGDRELMILRAKINKATEVRMALDTGASQTTLDLNVLLMEGISLRDSVGQQRVETANGIIIADIFNLSELEFAGMVFTDVHVQVIDFIAHGVFSDYGGYLGLDLISKRDFCINFEKSILIF
jgi:hypothetical protein